MSKINELLQKRNGLIAQGREVLEAAEKDGRDGLRSDEQTKYDAIDADVTALDGHIARLRKQESFETEQNASAGRRAAGAFDNASQLSNGRRDAVSGLRNWFLAGSDVERTDEMEASAKRAGLRLDQKSVTFKVNPETYSLRANQVTSNNELGGYTVADEVMREIEIAQKVYGGARQSATTWRTATGATLPVPTNDDTSTKGEIVGQGVQVANAGFTFNVVNLGAYKFSSKLICVSVEFLQDNGINFLSFLGQQLGTRIGRITNEKFTVGAGSTEPSGLVLGTTWTRPANGTGLSTTITVDQLIDVEHSLNAAYRPKAQWMFNDAQLKLFRKLKDDSNNYLLQPAVTAGAPDTILGYSYIINNDVATPAANAKAVLFGDFSKFVVRDVLDFSIQRLDERFAEFGQVAFIGFSRHDSSVIDAGTHPIVGHQYAQAES